MLRPLMPRISPLISRYISARPLVLRTYHQIEKTPRIAIQELERQLLCPERAEVSLSGTDDEVACHQSSYDPSITTPEKEFQRLEEECKLEGIVDPLFYSPANFEFNRIIVGQAIQSVRKIGSAKGWTSKHKEVHIHSIPGGPFDRYDKLLRELKEKVKNIDHST